MILQVPDWPAWASRTFLVLVLCPHLHAFSSLAKATAAL